MLLVSLCRSVCRKYDTTIVGGNGESFSYYTDSTL